MSETELLDTTPKCWICSVNDADSREHRIKGSDQKIVFNGQLPIYYGKNRIRQQEPITDFNDKSFKYDPSLCRKCNNEVTQKSDLAWEKLSRSLHNDWELIKLNKAITLSKIFPNNVDRNMILVQLYFVKMFGCAITEFEAPINLNSFSKAILTQNEKHPKEHPFVYISFRDSADLRSESYAEISDIDTFKNNAGIVEFAYMFYRIGDVTVDIIYSENNYNIDLNGALKPSDMCNNNLLLCATAPTLRNLLYER
ncbi:MAG: hypothetical protein QX189_00945 [Methylococcales bacterium]